MGRVRVRKTGTISQRSRQQSSLQRKCSNALREKMCSFHRRAEKEIWWKLEKESDNTTNTPHRSKSMCKVISELIIWHCTSRIAVSRDGVVDKNCDGEKIPSLSRFRQNGMRDWSSCEYSPFGIVPHRTVPVDEFVIVQQKIWWGDGCGEGDSGRLQLPVAGLAHSH